MASDEPPYLTVGTEVSARYKGAFCEAKVKKVNRQVKCRVNYKNSMGSALVPCDAVKGTLRVGSTIEAKHSDTGQYHEAVITKLNDCSQYTVVFDDGDVTTLRRTSLCLKSGKHFAESETLDQLPLTNPEHFGTPVVNIKSKRKRRDDSSDEGPTPAKSKKESSPAKNKYHLKELEADLGRIVCVDYGDKRKKDSWFPGLIVSPTVQDNVTINQKEDYLIRSFKDGKYYTVSKKDARPFKKEIINKVDGNQLKAVEKAIQFIENSELPTHWDKDALLNVENEDEQSDTDSDSSNDEPTEDEDRFIAQLYNFMDERSTPINKAPSIGSKDLNLYKLFNIVQKFGGYNRVTNQTKWKTVHLKMGLQSSSSNGTGLIKQAYRKYLLGFEEIHKKLGYTMVGKESTRSGRSSRNVRPPVKATVKKKPKVEEKEKKEPSVESENSRKCSNASSNDDQPDIETRRTPRGKGKEEKEESSPTKKIKSEPLPKKETRNNSSVKNNDKAKEDKEKEKEKATPRGRQKKEESEKTTTTTTTNTTTITTTTAAAAATAEQKPTELPPFKRQGRKKSVIEPPSKPIEDNESCNNEDQMKNGPVEVGDRVKVKYGNGNNEKIYEAKVREIRKEDKSKNFLVHYTGWNMRYDEWVDGHNIECIQEKGDGKPPNIKKKNTSAPKNPEPPKAMKRGRTISERSNSSVKGPPPKVKSNSDTTVSSTSTPAKASTSKVNSPSVKPTPTSTNGKSPSRNLSTANSNSSMASDDSPSSRVSRSTRSERKAPVKSGSTTPVLETRRRSQKTSGLFPQGETSPNEAAADSSSEDDDKSESKHEPNLRTRRRKETERSASLEPVKKLNTRSSASKKHEKTNDDTDNEASCADDDLNSNKSSPNMAPLLLQSDGEDDSNTSKIYVETESYPHLESNSRIVEQKNVAPDKKEEITDKTKPPCAKEIIVDDSEQSDSENNKSSLPGLATPEPIKLPTKDSASYGSSEAINNLSPPILIAQVTKSETQPEPLKEENVNKPGAQNLDKKFEEDSKKLPEQIDSIESKVSVSKSVKRKRIKKKVVKNESPTSSEKEENEPKEEVVKVECNKEVLKVEGTAIVEDAFRKMAASLNKTILNESIKTLPEIIKETTADADSDKGHASTKQLATEDIKKEEAQTPLAGPNVETKDHADTKDLSFQNTETVPQINLNTAKPDTDNTIEECEVTSHNPEADDEDEEVKLIGVDSTEVSKVKKKKLKDKDSKEPKNKKNKKKEKKLKSKEDDDACKDGEKMDSEKAKKKDKKKTKKADDFATGSENLSFLAEVTVNSPIKKEKKKSKKAKEKLADGVKKGDETEKKAKKKKDRDSEDDKKVRKVKKKKGKVKGSDEVEKNPPEVVECKDLGASISLLCDEDVLPASPIPTSDIQDKVIVPDIYPHSSGSSLAALAPALAAELQHPSSLTINTAINPTNNSTISHNQYAFSPSAISQLKQYEPISEKPQLLADNTPPTTPEGSITTNSIISSPSHEREGLEGSSSYQEVSGNTSPRSGPESCTIDHESREEDKASHELTADSTEKDTLKRKRKHSKRTRNISESSRSSIIKVKSATPKDTDPGTDSSDAKEKNVETAYSYTHLPPKSSKFNFHVPLSEYTDGAKRIELIQDKMTELRKTYMSLKAELAQIDRRRKKARKKEREAAVENQIVTNPIQCS